MPSPSLVIRHMSPNPPLEFSCWRNAVEKPLVADPRRRANSNPRPGSDATRLDCICNRNLDSTKDSLVGVQSTTASTVYSPKPNPPLLQVCSIIHCYLSYLSHTYVPYLTLQRYMRGANKPFARPLTYLVPCISFKITKQP